MASDRDSQAVQFVKPNGLHRPGLAVGKDDRLADKLGLDFLERAENRRRAELQNWHGCLGSQTLAGVGS